MKNVRVGVIGVGVMGERHCRVYSNMRQVNLVGIVDQDRSRGQAVAATYETRYFENYRHLLQEVDAVSIAAPTSAHFDLAMAALEYGVHVLVEKPITATLEQAKQLVAQAGTTTNRLQVGHIERFNPAYIELTNVTEGLNLVAVNIRRLSPFDTSNTDVDVIRDLMVHDLDLVTDLVANSSLGGFDAWGRTLTTKAIDHAVATLSFKDGPIATLFASRITEQKVRLVEVIADGAYIEADLLSKSLLIHRRTFHQFFDADKYRQESVIERIHVPMAEPLMLELEHFVQSIRTGDPPRVSGQDGLYTLQLAESISQQITTDMAL